MINVGYQTKDRSPLIKAAIAFAEEGKLPERDELEELARKSGFSARDVEELISVAQTRKRAHDRFEARDLAGTKKRLVDEREQVQQELRQVRLLQPSREKTRREDELQDRSNTLNRDLTKHKRDMKLAEMDRGYTLGGTGDSSDWKKMN